MKRQFIYVPVFVIMIFSVIISCEKSKSDKQDLSAGAEKFLELKTRINAMNAGSGQMSDFLSVIGNSEIKEGELNISGTNVDSSYIDSISVNPDDYWEYITCATVTEYDNPDGTHTTIYDYGDGCDEYGALYKGKITYIWRNEGNDYYSKVVYEDYYSYGVKMNGMSEYSFTSDGNSYFSTGEKENINDSTVSISPVEFNWSGSSTGHEEITMVTDDGFNYYYLSVYSNKWDSVSYSVLEGEYYFKNESDENNSEYHYTVTQPLVTNYKCIDSWVPVSGVETITNKENDKTSSYSVDYGNGTCDNLAVLTENGKTSLVDFSEIYYNKVDSSGSSAPGVRGSSGKK
jgi:hypothetical protein